MPTFSKSMGFIGRWVEKAATIACSIVIYEDLARDEIDSLGHGLNEGEDMGIDSIVQNLVSWIPALSVFKEIISPVTSIMTTQSKVQT